ncbi:MAG: hypothetical protein EOP32_21310 [Rhodococcus sp. (in: high G+C Gram-positive bacteria)]|nr:MAG: hypothetical protein EOP32_21310 [Rhodococcus sp. (in: high G+C Gram-positive bacteria)]
MTATESTTMKSSATRQDEFSADSTSSGEPTVTTTEVSIEPGHAVAQRSRRRVLVLGCSAFILCALLAIGAVLFGKVRAMETTDTSRSEAVAAARDLLPKVLSYSYDTLDASLTGATDALTGDFKSDFQQLVDSAVRPSAADRKIVTTTAVQDASVVDADQAHATVLAFINQSTTAADQQTPKIDGARLRIGLEKVDGRWLISSIDPV